MVSKIRDYRIISKIGQGGMGDVYLAEDENLGRRVAIKILSPQLISDSQFIDRFRQEARVQASLVHSNIVTLYSFFTEQNMHCMVMEYAEGRTLKEVIKSDGALSEDYAKKILSQMLDAVGHAHTRGVIHRDIKPSNIMIDSEHNVKIMDFGIAKILGDKGLTNTGSKVGTIYYMSPEQIRAEKDIDQRTDIYSLGVTFYEMLTGILPYEINTDSDFEIMNAIVYNEIKDVKNISKNCRDVLTNMLAKEKANRYVTCHACSEALNNDKKNGLDKTICKPVQNNIILDAKDDWYRIKREDNQIIEPEMVLVEGGSFIMGENAFMSDRRPAHKVELDTFYIGKYTVTFEEYDLYCNSTGAQKPDDRPYGRGHRPVMRVNWNDAVKYCEWLSKKTGKNYRLPTEAEWEYAARGGNESRGYKYSGSDSIHDVAWYSDNSNRKLNIVGQKESNELGIFDMSGNVWEWCSDWYDAKYYRNSCTRNPKGPDSGNNRVFRGGSWYNYVNDCCITFRGYYSPGRAGSNVGFRLVSVL